VRTISHTGLSLIKHFEDLKLRAYLCPAGVWIIGYGCTRMKDQSGKWFPVTKGMEITEKQAEKLLIDLLVEFEESVERNLIVATRQYEFDALVSHAFNCGYSETMYKRVNNGGDVKEWFLNHYITGDGVVLGGLVRRRHAEWYLFNAQLNWMEKTINEDQNYKDGTIT